MLYSILPEWLYNEITNSFLPEFVFEIRIRINKPIVINYKGNYQVLCRKDGYNNTAIIANIELVEYVLNVATKQSLYAYNDQIKHCYVTTDSGIRIGVCGRVVSNEGKVSTIKNISSLNIRVSHQVPNCSEKILNFVYVNGNIKNTLVISPPGAGKTTLIRDLAYKLSNEKQVKNLLIVDERFEIAGFGQNSILQTGDYSDVISGCNKYFAFNEALKTMSPAVIVTDEISTEDDISSIKETIKSGVKVIATAHAGSIEDLKYKKYFDSIIKDKYFERIIVLSTRNGVGTIEGVFDDNFRCLYIPYMIWRYY